MSSVLLTKKEKEEARLGAWCWGLGLRIPSLLLEGQVLSLVLSNLFLGPKCMNLAKPYNPMPFRVAPKVLWFFGSLFFLDVFIFFLISSFNVCFYSFFIFFKFYPLIWIF